jgi:hypothetical protein
MRAAQMNVPYKPHFNARNDEAAVSDLVSNADSIPTLHLTIP